MKYGFYDASAKQTKQNEFDDRITNIFLGYAFLGFLVSLLIYKVNGY